MSLDHVQGPSFLGIANYEFLHEIDGSWWYTFWILDSAAIDLLEHFALVVIVKGLSGGQKNEKNDANGEGIGLCSVVALLLGAVPHLWGAVMWRTASGSQQQVAVVLHCAEAEIGNLEIAMRVQQEVFRLEVAVVDLVLVTVVYSVDELTEISAGQGLFQAAVGFYEGEEIPPRGEVHDEVNTRTGDHYVVQANNVGVGECAKNAHFATNVEIGRKVVLENGSCYNFDSVILAGEDVSCATDLSKVAFAEGFQHVVNADARW